MKTCSKCGEQKKIVDNFRDSKSHKDGYFMWCRECEHNYYIEYRLKNADTIKEKNKIHYSENKLTINGRRREKYQENPEKYREVSRIFNVNNPEKVKEYNKKYYQDNTEILKKKSKLWVVNNPEKRKIASDIWRKDNPDKIKTSTKKSYQKTCDNPQHKINRNIGRGMNHTLREGKKKGRHWELLVPYTLSQLTNHLEKLFTPEMSWDNYGSYWHIDHIFPKSKFNFICPDDEEFKKCWDLSNLQPLEKVANLKKHNKII